MLQETWFKWNPPPLDPLRLSAPGARPLLHWPIFLLTFGPLLHFLLCPCPRRTRLPPVKSRIIFGSSSLYIYRLLELKFVSCAMCNARLRRSTPPEMIATIIIYIVYWNSYHHHFLWNHFSFSQSLNVLPPRRASRVSPSPNLVGIHTLWMGKYIRCLIYIVYWNS